MERARFGPDEAAFHYWLFVTLVSAVVNVLVAYLALRTTRSHAQALATTHSWKSFAAVAVAQSVASATALAALDYVDFPTQTLGKCAKPISILATGLFFFSGKGGNYSLKKAATAILVCVGIAVFFLGKPGAASAGGSVSVIGIALILVSLVCDGLVGGFQGSLKSRGGNLSPYQLMLFVNFWSVLLILGALVANGQLLPAVSFVLQHPRALLLVIGLNVSMAFGQLFIYMLLTEFDPLVCSLTTTTRKFFSILASVVIYGSPVSTWQWVGIGLVFAGLLLPELQDLVSRQFGKAGHHGKKE
jgi:UDP-galactose transporter B1